MVEYLSYNNVRVAIMRFKCSNIWKCRLLPRTLIMNKTHFSIIADFLCFTKIAKIEQFINIVLKFINDYYI